MGGAEGCSCRVLIPESIQRMVRLIKEIVIVHSDDDVYAILKECFMDPNEAVQKLLQLGIHGCMPLLLLLFVISMDFFNNEL